MDRGQDGHRGASVSPGPIRAFATSILAGASILASVLLAACGAPGSIDGADFDLGDAVFALRQASESDLSVTEVLISDADDLCGLARSNGSLAGRKALRIRAYSGGSSRFEWVEFDESCEVLERERADLGWVELAGSGFDDRRVSFAVRTAKRSLTGELSASYCHRSVDWSMGCGL